MFSNKLNFVQAIGRFLPNSQITVSDAMDVVISPRQPTINYHELEILGDRIQKVRNLMTSKSCFGWSLSYWCTVEAQLQRKLNILQIQLGVK
jgi:hypothetical protein